MIRVLRNERLALRFFGDDVGVLCRRDGARHAFQGPLVTVVRQLAEELGVNGLLQLAAQDVSTDPRERQLVGLIRGLFQRLDQEKEPTELKALYRSCPRLSEVSFQERIPLTGMCEVTFRCNLRCVHCFVLHKIQEARPAHTQEEDILNLLHSLDTLGCINVTLTGGEITLHRGYQRFVSTAKSLQLFTVLKTNATTFSRGRAEAYAQDPAHETHASLYGSNPTSHDAFTAVPGSFEKTLDGLRELGQAGVRCKINCTVWSGNTGELDDMERIITDLGHRIVFDDIIHGRLNGDRSPLSLRISPQDREKLIEQGRLQRFKASPCTAGHMKVKIDAEGAVATCELFPGGFGNAFQVPLEKLWRLPDYTRAGSEAVELSTKEKEGGVTIRSCPGLNFLNTGSMAGKTQI